ncbi:restriction endonuclease subunit S [Alistipes putredinis]|jgi:type I restriction enzyme S subunit|uniref:restriction endonuclease subunit S n=1 Tax=Alistipes putredinis TaxID=28117 RepID=UPI003AB26C18
MELKKIHISDIGKIVTGKTPRTSVAENYDGYIPFLTPSDDLSHKSAPKTTKTLTEQGLNEVRNCLLPSRSICVSCIGSDLGKVVMTKEPTVTNQQFNSIIPNKNFNADFVYYFMTLVGRELNYLSKTSTAVPIINKSSFSNYEIEVPDLETQNRIASILSSIDSKIELNRRINDNLEQQAQALFKSWFVDFEPFRGGEFVDSALGSTPKELPIVYIEDIPHNIESGKRPKGGATFEGVPSIGAENIKGLGYYDYSKTKYIPKEYAQTIKKGKINGYELLIYKDGGKPGYFIPNFSIFGEGFPFNEMYINEHVFILDLMDNAYNAFAYFYMRTPYIMNQLNSIGGKAAIPGINTKDIECLPIYSNESPYVKRYGDIVLPFIKTILSNSLENARLAKMRDTLLPQLMSGELKISE